VEPWRKLTDATQWKRGWRQRRAVVLKGRASIERARPCWLRTPSLTDERTSSIVRRPRQSAASWRRGFEERTATEEDLRPWPLGPMSPTASRHRHAGLTFFVPRQLAWRQIQFYLVSLHKAESHSVPMRRRRRPSRRRGARPAVDRWRGHAGARGCHASLRVALRASVGGQLDSWVGPLVMVCRCRFRRYVASQRDPRMSVCGRAWNPFSADFSP
jgi:hypothetical protein